MPINRKTVVTALLMLFMCSLLGITLIFEGNFLLISFILVVFSIFLLIYRFEKRKIEAKEMVLLALMGAIAAVGRIPFASIPSVQPTTFVIFIAGFALGPESGFIIGLVAALASNMVLGQGPWTPWQMMAWGLVGWTSGLLANCRIGNRLFIKILFGVLWGFLFGWIMNLWSILAFSPNENIIDLKLIFTYMAGSLFYDSMHSVSNVLFILLFGNKWISILTRFKSKYGLFKV